MQSGGALSSLSLSLLEQGPLQQPHLQPHPHRPPRPGDAVCLQSTKQISHHVFCASKVQI